ncbi:phosphoesterase [Sulfolobales archaeon HS-7]|nr:phosphoesterase [Sulfolobales archaeon HS-7]
MPSLIKIAFTTDLHGSTVAFNKVVNQFKRLKCDYLIIGGNLVSNETLIVRKSQGKMIVDGKEVSKAVIDNLAEKTGVNVIIEEGKELEPNEINAYKLEAQLNRASSWLEKIKDIKEKVIWNLADRDPSELEQVFRKYEIELADDKVIELDNLYLVSEGFGTNIEGGTKAITDSELFIRGEKLLKKVDEPNKVILNFHMPPFQSRIDETSINGKKVNMGSKAVLDLIKEFNPLLGLHGHVHHPEAVISQVGKTKVSNPGSYYEKGFYTMTYAEIERKAVSLGTLATAEFKIKTLSHYTDFVWDPVFGS